MKHQEARALLGDYLEGDLPLPRRALVDAHLDDCAECATHLSELRCAVDALHALVDPLPPPGLAAAVMARIATGEGRPGLVARYLERVPWTIRTRLAMPGIAVLAAALLFVWLRPSAEVPMPGGSPPTLQETLGDGPIGASAVADDAPAGPAVSSDALARALRDPEALLRATEGLDPAARQAFVTALAGQAGDTEELRTLTAALRALADPRGAALAAELSEATPAR